jgi:hypothetical protein
MGGDGGLERLTYKRKGGRELKDLTLKISLPPILL